MKLYPLQFEPIFKDRIWGGIKLKTVLEKTINSNIVGESWEISTVENEVSIVANGSLKGKSLIEVISDYPEALLGRIVYKKFGIDFPLLLKYIDAREDLSIQVHPNDAMAKKYHNSFGKTEMWYVIQADKDSRLIVGFKEDSSPESYLKNLKNNSLLDILDTKNVNSGDVFMLNTGTIHAIGAGVVLAEIQQKSDVTYRVYDFDRVDENGKRRELHHDLALEALNYKKTATQRNYTKTNNISNEVVSCDYFTTNLLPLDGTIEVYKNDNSFTVYMCVEGDFLITIEEEKFNYKKGDTVLIPAQLTDFRISGKATILEIYIS